MSTVTVKQAKRPKPKWRKMSPLSYFVLGVVGFVSIFPFYWMVIVASNGNEEVSKEVPTLLIGPRLFEVIGHVFEANEYFGISMWNTVFVGTIVAAAQVFFSSIAGFAFAMVREGAGQRLHVVLVEVTRHANAKPGGTALRRVAFPTLERARVVAIGAVHAQGR